MTETPGIARAAGHLSRQRHTRPGTARETHQRQDAKNLHRVIRIVVTDRLRRHSSHHRASRSRTRGATGDRARNVRDTPTAPATDARMTASRATLSPLPPSRAAVRHTGSFAWGQSQAGNLCGVPPTYRDYCRPAAGTASAACRPRTGTKMSSSYRGRTQDHRQPWLPVWLPAASATIITSSQDAADLHKQVGATGFEPATPRL